MTSSTDTFPDQSLLYILDLVATCLSLLGSSVMLFFCVKTRTKSVSIKLLASIAICDLVYSIANLMSAFEYTNNQFLCQSEAFIREFSLVSSMFMATCLSIICYKVSNLEKPINLDKFFRRSVIVCFVLGLTLSFAPLYIPQVSYVNGILLCWINVNPKRFDTHAQIVTLIFQATPTIVGLITTSIAYILTIRQIKSLPPMVVNKLGHSVYRLLWYPAMLFITYIPGLVDMFLQVLKVSPPTWVIALHMVLTHSIGLTNAIVYGVQTKLFCTKDEETPITGSLSSRNSINSEMSVQLQIAQAIDFSAEMN